MTADTGTLARLTNGIDIERVDAVGQALLRDPQQARMQVRVTSTWDEGMRSTTKVQPLDAGGAPLPQTFSLRSDEPDQLGGSGSGPTPFDLLLAALNSCMLVGYAYRATQAGLQIRRITIEADCDLDMRGFFGDETVPPGCRVVRQMVKIEGDGTAADWLQIHRKVQATSPIYHSLTNPVRVETTLEVG
jgi:uncharacterized OsmC-like protein